MIIQMVLTENTETITSITEPNNELKSTYFVKDFANIDHY